MSNVAKAGPAVGTSPGAAGRPEGGERAPKAGTFDRVLHDKARADRTEALEHSTDRQASAVGERSARTKTPIPDCAPRPPRIS